MLYSFLECTVYLLAAYGLLVLILGAIDMLQCRIAGKRPKVRVVLLVQDAEEQIEYIIRYALKKNYASRVFSDKKMIIIDMNSSDRTHELLERLQRSYSGIEALSEKEKEQIFNDFGTFSPSGK